MQTGVGDVDRALTSPSAQSTLSADKLPSSRETRKRVVRTSGAKEWRKRVAQRVAGVLQVKPKCARMPALCFRTVIDRKLFCIMIPLSARYARRDRAADADTGAQINAQISANQCKPVRMPLNATNSPGRACACPMQRNCTRRRVYGNPRVRLRPSDHKKRVRRRIDMTPCDTCTMP